MKGEEDVLRMTRRRSAVSETVMIHAPGSIPAATSSERNVGSVKDVSTIQTLTRLYVVLLSSGGVLRLLPDPRGTSV